MDGRTWKMPTLTRLVDTADPARVINRRAFLGIATRAAIGALGGAALLTACGRTKPPLPTASHLTVMTNADDPLLLRAQTEEGDVVEYFGRRTDGGVPASIDHVSVLSGDRVTHEIQLDDGGHPERIVLEDTTEFTLERISDRYLRVTVVTDDGTQVETEVDLYEGAGAACCQPQYDGAVVPVIGTAARGHQRVSVCPTPPGTDSATMCRAAAEPSATPGQVSVHVTECGVPAGHLPYVRVQVRTLGANVGNFVATKAGDGVYMTTLPTNLAFEVDPQAVCSALASALSAACVANQTLTPEVRALICAQASGAAGPLAPKVLAACASAMAAVHLYCAATAPVPGFPDPLDMLCAAIFENRTFKADLELRAWTPGLPTAIAGPWVTAPAAGPFPVLSLDLGEAARIRSLTLSPSSPSAGTGYVATTRIACIPAGALVTVSVVGTDGYADSVAISVPSSLPEGTYSLSVPGAEAAVRDTVTVLVALPGGGELTRTAFLVFG